MASANVIELDDSNFDSVIAGASEPLLVDFWAPWCAPCRMLSPVVEEIAGENVGKFKVTKVNVDESPSVSDKFGIRSIPTLLFFKSGEKRDQTVGVLGKAEIIRRLQALV
ncbi:MAG TPA: thioredoxin [Terrimicrobiaceae bacterium]|jgi:thioredoxin|nr:thioredoxin [Terrimicrobiaceae bacterium]